MTKPVNIGVIGAGYWGPNLIRNVAQLPDAHLHTVCDSDAERLQQIQAQFAPQHITTDMYTLLQTPEIDGVIIATPAVTHAEVAEACLRAGKHVLVEKPMALTVQDSQALIDVAAAQNRILMVGHVFEYNPAVLKLAEIIHSGEIGDVLYIYATRVNLGKIRNDLNAFWNLAPHDISIVNMLLGGAPERVSARGYQLIPKETPMEDVVFAILEYPNGIVTHIHTSWLDPNKVRRMTVVGTKKMVVYDDVSDNRITIYDKGVVWVEGSDYGVHRLMTFTGDIYIPKIPPQEPLREEILHFITCIQTGQSPRSDGQDGLNVVRVLEAVNQSIHQAGSLVNV
jgi:predicted dehydrogenase